MSKEVKIKITVDGKQVEKSVKDLTKEFNVAEKSVAEINKRLKELREASTQVATGSEEFRELNDEIRRLNLETRQAAGALNELGQREPLSNVRKGFEDSALAITSVNTVLGIANQLFEGNEKIQKIINRTQLAFNAILTATQLIKEKEAIIDGVRNARLVAYNALMPIATNLTRIFGVTTAQAMALATGGITLLIGGIAVLVSSLASATDGEEDLGNAIDETNAKVRTRLELELELARIVGNQRDIREAEIAVLEEEISFKEKGLKILEDTINGEREKGNLVKASILNAAQNLRDEIKINQEKIKALKNQKDVNKETQKQRDLQKEISDFIKKNRLELAKSLSQAVSDLDVVIGSFAGSFEQTLSKQLESINAFPDAIVKSINQAQEKIKEFEDALKAGGLTNQQRKELVALNNELDRLRDTFNAIKDPIRELQDTIIDGAVEQIGDDINKVFVPLQNIQGEIEKLLGPGSLGDLQSVFDNVGFSIRDATQFTFELVISNVNLTREFKKLKEQIDGGKLSDEELTKTYQRLNEISQERIQNSNSINEAQNQINDLVELSVKVGNDALQVEQKKINNTKTLTQNQIDYNNSIIEGIESQITELQNLDVLTEAQEIFIQLSKARIEVLKQQNVVLSQQDEEQVQSYSKFTKRFDEINKKSDSFFEKFRGEVVVIQQSLQSVLEIGQAAGDLRIAKIQEEIDIMEERYARELELISRTADEDARRIEDSLLSEEVKADAIRVLREREANDNRIIELRREQERKKLERERNLAQQRSQISQAIMGAALAVIQAFAQLGPIAGAIAAAGVGITTGLQIATIRKQKFNKGGKVKGPGSPTSDSIPAMLSNGESVINANSTKMFEPLLSKINEIGGGVRFNRGGVAGDTPSMAQSEIVDIEKLAQRIGDELRSVPMKTYVVAQDVTNEQQIIQQIKRKSIV